MSSPILTLAASFLLAAAPGIEPGTQLTYSGSMTGVKDDGDAAVKEFTLTLVAVAGAGEGTEFVWTLDESGRGGWTWLDRFGRTSDQSESGPALLYSRNEGKSIVPLIGPRFAAADKLQAGATWTEDRLEHKVVGEKPTRRAIEGVPQTTWELDIRSPYGHKRTLWIDKDSPLVVAMHETVFIGQGDEHKLTLELSSLQRLSPDETTKLSAAMDDWQALRTSLGWEPLSRREELSGEQIAKLKAALPEVAKRSAIGPLAAIAAAAQRDATGQKNRAGAVAALAEAIIGQPVDWMLTDLSGKPLKAKDYEGKVVVLHFWEYRDAPLEEPYGQVGYLDFLLRRRPEAVVIGVHVDPRLADDETRRASLANAKKLKSFMNLSYPIGYDDGALLKRVGDPRVAGGKLPLFVVLGKDGKVAAYHAGLYDVKAVEGLKELEAIVEKLAK
jgi:hypothetical protein